MIMQDIADSVPHIAMENGRALGEAFLRPFVDKGVRYTGGLGLLARAAIDLPVIPCLYLASLPYKARATKS